MPVCSHGEKHSRQQYASDIHVEHVYTWAVVVEWESDYAFFTRLPSSLAMQTWAELHHAVDVTASRLSLKLSFKYRVRLVFFSKTEISDS